MNARDILALGALIGQPLKAYNDFNERERTRELAEATLAARDRREYENRLALQHAAAADQMAQAVFTQGGYDRRAAEENRNRLALQTMQDAAAMERDRARAAADIEKAKKIFQFQKDLQAEEKAEVLYADAAELGWQFNPALTRPQNMASARAFIDQKYEPEYRRLMGEAGSVTDKINALTGVTRTDPELRERVLATKFPTGIFGRLIPLEDMTGISGSKIKDGKTMIAAIRDGSFDINSEAFSKLPQETQAAFSNAMTTGMAALRAERGSEDNLKSPLVQALFRDQAAAKAQLDTLEKKLSPMSILRMRRASGAGVGGEDAFLEDTDRLGPVFGPDRAPSAPAGLDAKRTSAAVREPSTNAPAVFASPVLGPVGPTRRISTVEIPGLTYQQAINERGNPSSENYVESLPARRVWSALDAIFGRGGGFKTVTNDVPGAEQFLAPPVFNDSRDWGGTGFK